MKEFQNWTDSTAADTSRIWLCVTFDLSPKMNLPLSDEVRESSSPRYYGMALSLQLFLELSVKRLIGLTVAVQPINPGLNFDPV